jgi:hypothetical protein
MRGAPCWNSGGDDDDATLLIQEVEVARLRLHRMPVKTTEEVENEVF